ncbi:MAG: FixH family protein [Ferruginibacter sp.]
MNWGYKIMIVYAVFVAGMLFLAFKSSKQNIELVTEDYYAKELVYQQKIDETKRADGLSEHVRIGMTGQQLNICFPQDFLGQPITGEVVLYCPADEKKDMRVPFSVTDSTINIPVPANYHGLNYIKINWSVAGVKYYCEQKLMIQ